MGVVCGDCVWELCVGIVCGGCVGGGVVCVWRGWFVRVCVCVCVCVCVSVCVYVCGGIQGVEVYGSGVP